MTDGEGERVAEGEGVLVEGGRVASDEREGERVEMGGEAVAVPEVVPPHTPPPPPPPPPTADAVTVRVGKMVLGGWERDLAVKVGRVVLKVVGVEEAHAVTRPTWDAVPVAVAVALAVSVLKYEDEEVSKGEGVGTGDVPLVALCMALQLGLEEGVEHDVEVALPPVGVVVGGSEAERVREGEGEGVKEGEREEVALRLAPPLARPLPVAFAVPLPPHHSPMPPAPCEAVPPVGPKEPLGVMVRERV